MVLRLLSLSIFMTFRTIIVTQSRRKELMYYPSNNLQKPTKGLKTFSIETVKNSHQSNEHTYLPKKL